MAQPALTFVGPVDYSILSAISCVPLSEGMTMEKKRASLGTVEMLAPAVLTQPQGGVGAGTETVVSKPPAGIAGTIRIVSDPFQLRIQRKEA
jgi:hypothetical protein